MLFLSDAYLCYFREKDVDIAFAQDTIDEYKVACNLMFFFVCQNTCK